MLKRRKTGDVVEAVELESDAEGMAKGCATGESSRREIMVDTDNLWSDGCANDGLDRQSMS